MSRILNFFRQSQMYNTTSKGAIFDFYNKHARNRSIKNFITNLLLVLLHIHFSEKAFSDH